MASERRGQRERRIVRAHALLKCGDFFRDELQASTFDFMSEAMGARLRQRFGDLRALVFDALDNPSVADAYKIKDEYRRASDE